MKRVARKEIVAWAMYDFANSAFATSVLTAIFPVFFRQHLVGEAGDGTAYWGYAVSVSMFLTAVAAPFVGAITDTTAAKKRFLFCFWLPGCVATSFLGFFGPGQWIPAAACFIVANIGFSSGNALYNAFLPELAPREAMDRVSGLGWGLGYLGGGLCLALNLYMVHRWQAVGGALAVVGAWWFILALPMFLMVKERATPTPVQGSRLAHGVRKVVGTLRRIRRFRELAIFLVSFLLYNDGVETVIVMAAVVGSEALGMSPSALILCILMIQGVALIGSFLFGWLALKLGSCRTLILALWVWCGVLVWAFFMTRQFEFWILGIMVGAVMGGTQAISRSLMGKFTPPQYSGEFFGFYAMGGKFSAVLGPLLFGIVKQTTSDVRWAILSVGVFFVAGLIGLSRVNEAKGIREAIAAEEKSAAVNSVG